MAVLYGRDGRLTAKNGGFRPGQSERGAFGDALAEVDWIVGNVVEALESNSIAENTLTLFTVRPARGARRPSRSL